MDAVYQIYERQILPLPVADRLKLVRLILDSLAESVSRWSVDNRDYWSRQDLHDASRASLTYASEVWPEEAEKC